MTPPTAPAAATANASDVTPGADVREAFRAAYENRYTWESGFGGYQGRCIWIQGDRRLEGRFSVVVELFGHLFVPERRSRKTALKVKNSHQSAWLDPRPSTNAPSPTKVS